MMDALCHFVQLCSIVLKQYVETHWNNLSEKFQEPEPPEQVTTIIEYHAEFRIRIARNIGGN